MNEEYASNEETREEVEARYEVAFEEAGEQDLITLLRNYDRARSEAASRHYRKYGPDLTDAQRAHVEKRTRFKEALAEETEARWGPGSQEA